MMTIRRKQEILSLFHHCDEIEQKADGENGIHHEIQYQIFKIISKITDNQHHQAGDQKNMADFLQIQFHNKPDNCWLVTKAKGFISSFRFIV